ncbi:hypothetical protein J4727_05355 [Providencia rettgeri]|uniref:Uncharacterized protein n=1 Tax=Providencia rettgeri TaxID=587 RepID=A0A939SJ38_PRORE|nr:hypothetical protein [Providencia rettgeri]
MENEPGVDIYGNKKGFAIFQDENDGRAALARQLLLIWIAAIYPRWDYEKVRPRKDNNKTGEYIRYVSAYGSWAISTFRFI